MLIKKGQVYNLWDTNGRRDDIINAYGIYLETLNELINKQNLRWGVLKSDRVCEYKFYKEVIKKSDGVFNNHPIFDAIDSLYGDLIEWSALNGFDKLKSIINDKNLFITLPDGKKKNVGKAINCGIEDRSRHYISTLEKMGFCLKDGTITECGYDFLNCDISRDELEKILPIDDYNIILLRQIMKLKVFRLESKDTILAFSPFFKALSLFKDKNFIPEKTFLSKIQFLEPNIDFEENDAIKNYLNNIKLKTLDNTLFASINSDLKLNLINFYKIFTNNKSSETSNLYFKFYNALYDFNKVRSEDNFRNLKSCFVGKSRSIIEKAFGKGEKIFDFGLNQLDFGVKTFLNLNKDNIFLNTLNTNITVFSEFNLSKFVDGIKEYSDTTKRVFTATGLFKFEKGLVSLSYRNIIYSFISNDYINDNIYKYVDRAFLDGYEKYDNKESIFFKSLSIKDYLNLKAEVVDESLKKINQKYNVLDGTIIDTLKKEAINGFNQHIKDKYSKKTVIRLLRMFSDRKNDLALKDEVNKVATVPTIFEYVCGLAWYYLRDQEVDLYDALKLTIDANFDPIWHAPGGEGDIIFDDDNIVTMIEASLNNKAAMANSEAIPVLRHSTNLKSRNKNKKVMTIYVGSELDFNTLNDWRYAFDRPRMSTDTHEMVDKITIFPLTNEEFADLLENNVTYDQIYDAVIDSYNDEFEIDWRENILKKLHN